ncbi:hypothetical protein RJT34_25516 [Clitoria ternatea]|uniref:Protein kinase domain-containing protein n=1 Tax=Clitoria ternatea TaxID=43366 RepID=A0AAN9FPX9_CLITE
MKLPQHYYRYPCHDFDIYYDGLVSPNKTEAHSFFSSCSVLQFPYKDRTDTTNILSFVSAEMMLQVVLSDDCDNCYNRRGGLCRLDKNRKFYCDRGIEKKRLTSILTLVIVVTGVAVLMACCFRNKILPAYVLFWRENPTHRIIEEFFKEHGPLPTASWCCPWLTKHIPSLAIIITPFFITVKPFHFPINSKFNILLSTNTLSFFTPHSILCLLLALCIRRATIMAKTTLLSHLIAPFLLFPFLLLVQGFTNPDFEALVAFKTASDTSKKLTTWNNSTNPCSWNGVSCIRDRVSRLVLENLELQGSMEPLTSLTQLRVLSLKGNRFSGHVPNLSNLSALKLLFLSQNNFSGEFPVSVTSLFRLYRLDLSHNNFSGEIPATLNHMTHLLTLRLDGNNFSGHIPGMNLPGLQDFNVSGNQLTGEIPKSLSGFPESSFGQNPFLCGAPVQKCSSDPTKPGSNGAIASPVLPNPNTPSTTISSSPSSVPKTTPSSSSSSNKTHENRTSKISPVALIAIIVGDVLVLGIVSLLLYCYFWRNYSAKLKEGKGSKLFESEKIVYSSSPYPAQGGFERGRMVFFEGEKRFELEDLLRASAEMLGKGGFGTAYKAVLDDGNVVAVKRLKDAQISGKREFEQHMEVLGRIRHPNIVSLRAYYFAREEKLLVYDYMPNGSLFWLLHGNRGPGRTPLDWTTRLKIAAGVARGVAFIHNSCKSLRLTHGNIKSTNILVDKQGNARVSDFGLSVFAGPGPGPGMSGRSNGYRAPEASDGRKQTHKSDVYSLGVVLLELLTGKCPSVVEGGGPGGGAVDLPRWVQSVVREEWTAEVFDLELIRYRDIEEEMVGLLQIAMSCTAAAPDQRPRIGHVVKMIEDLRGVEVSPCHDTLDSVSESPSLSEDACGTSH